MYSTLKRDPPETRGTLDASEHRTLLRRLRDEARAKKGQRKRSSPFVPIDDILARAPPAHREVMKTLVRAIFANKRDEDQNFWLLAKKENLRLRAALFSYLKERPSAPAPHNIAESWTDFPFYFEVVEGKKSKQTFFAMIKNQQLDLFGKEESFNETLRIFGFS